MAVTDKELREYLRLPPDSLTLTGEATVNKEVFMAAVPWGGVYEFKKINGDWALNGSVANLATYGIVADAGETEITVDYLTTSVSMYLSAAFSKARTAGVPVFTNNAQYDLFILALASMYYENRAMVYDGTRPDFLEAAGQRIIDSFVLELRHAKEDEQ